MWPRTLRALDVVSPGSYLPGLWGVRGTFPLSGAGAELGPAWLWVMAPGTVPNGHALGDRGGLSHLVQVGELGVSEWLCPGLELSLELEEAVLQPNQSQTSRSSRRTPEPGPDCPPVAHGTHHLERL